MSIREAVPNELSQEQIGDRIVQLLDEPYVMIPAHDPAASLRVLAHSVNSLDKRDVLVEGYVATKPGRATILDEFTDRPTGEVTPCNAVKGFVGEGLVYNKNVSTDMPLSGLRTVIAQRRAAKAVRRNIK